MSHARSFGNSAGLYHVMEHYVVIRNDILKTNKQHGRSKWLCVKWAKQYKASESAGSKFNYLYVKSLE